MNVRSVMALSLSGMMLSLVGGLAACEGDQTSGRGPDLHLPDGSLSPLDGGATGLDAGDVPDADAAAADVDAADAADAADASDGGDTVSYSGLVGDIGGTLYEDRCPAGQLAVGVEAGTVGVNFYSGVLSKMRTLCGTPVLPTGASTAITIGPGVAVPESPGARGTEPVTSTTQVTCPADQVVVGIAGDTIVKNFPPLRDLPAYLQIVCAPLSYTNGTVTVGTAAPAGGIGTPTDTSVGPFECEPNKVAAGLRVHAGQILDAVAARCEPAVVLP